MLENLLRVLRIFDFGVSKIQLFEKWLIRENLNKTDVKELLVLSIENKKLDWVKLAIQTKFVYTIEELPPEKFDVDHLIIFTDSFVWQNAVRRDSILQKEQKNLLKTLFREVGLNHYRDIHELMTIHEFDWLPFEVKLEFKSYFGKIHYTNSDIIFYLKEILWDYLDMGFQKKNSLNELSKTYINLLSSYSPYDGWVDLDWAEDQIQKEIADIDIFDINKFKSHPKIQHRKHFRNPFSAGYQRIAQM